MSTIIATVYAGIGVTAYIKVELLGDEAPRSATVPWLVIEITAFIALLLVLLR